MMFSVWHRDCDANIKFALDVGKLSMGPLQNVANGQERQSNPHKILDILQHTCRACVERATYEARVLQAPQPVKVYLAYEERTT